MKFQPEDIVHVDSKEAAKAVSCSVCLCLWVDPVQTMCQHIFCRSCIDPLLACPHCRRDFSGLEPSKRYTPLRDINLFALNQMNDLKVHCPNATPMQQGGSSSSSGPGTGSSSATEDDQTGAGATGGEPATKRVKREQDHETECAVADASSCTWTGTYGDLLAKHMAECPCQLISCPRGCGMEFPRGELTAHEKTCAKNLTKCEICGEMIKEEALEQHNEQKARLHVYILQKKLAEASPLLDLVNGMDKRLQRLEEETAKSSQIASLRGHVSSQIASLQGHVATSCKKAADDARQAVANLPKSSANTSSFFWTVDVQKAYADNPNRSRKITRTLQGPNGSWELVFLPQGYQRDGWASVGLIAPPGRPVVVGTIVLRSGDTTSLHIVTQGQELARHTFDQVVIDSDVGTGMPDFAEIAKIKKHKKVIFYVDFVSVQTRLPDYG
ncbi:unnamed protein product [Amoebophrya sp. A120]|nr:unnamed protein product [Amoebophrya sp. A120]|eukprot:GSA120T00001125001.1